MPTTKQRLRIYLDPEQDQITVWAKRELGLTLTDLVIRAFSVWTHKPVVKTCWEPYSTTRRSHVINISPDQINQLTVWAKSFATTRSHVVNESLAYWLKDCGFAANLQRYIAKLNRPPIEKEVPEPKDERELQLEILAKRFEHYRRTQNYAQMFSMQRQIQELVNLHPALARSAE